MFFWGSRSWLKLMFRGFRVGRRLQGGAKANSCFVAMLGGGPLCLGFSPEARRRLLFRAGRRVWWHCSWSGGRFETPKDTMEIPSCRSQPFEVGPNLHAETHRWCRWVSLTGTSGEANTWRIWPARRRWKPWRYRAKGKDRRTRLGPF